MTSQERLTELDRELYQVYREAYERTPIGKIARLDPNTGRLAKLWREWDEEMAKTEGN